MSAETTLNWTGGGRSLDLYGAALKVDGQRFYADLGEDALEAVFKVNLKRGTHVMRALFSGGNDVVNSTVIAPYYVSLRQQVRDRLVLTCVFGNDR